MTLMSTSRSRSPWSSQDRSLTRLALRRAPKQAQDHPNLPIALTGVGRLQRADLDAERRAADSAALIVSRGGPLGRHVVSSQRHL
jgi:hypothetical protein